MNLNVQNNALRSLLNADGRTLENFKFFPGDKLGLTVDEVCSAAALAVQAALADGLVDTAPHSGLQQSQL